MPSKYSHALVLSQYDSDGIFTYYGPSTARGTSSSSFTTARSTPFRSTPRSKPTTTAQSSRSSPSTPQPFSAARTRSGTSTPYMRIEASPPPQHRKSSSVETQIYAPPSPPPTRDYQRPSYIETRPHTPRHQASIETQIYNPQSPRSSPSSTNMTDWSRSSEVKARRRATQASTPNKPRPGSRNKLAKESGNNTPSNSQTPPLTDGSHESATIGTQTFVSSRPPSPPATPESGKSFGLETFLDRIDKGKLLASTALKSSKKLKHDISPNRLERKKSEGRLVVSGHSEPSSESLVILPQVPPDSGKSFGLKNHVNRSKPTKPSSPVTETSVQPNSLRSSTEDRHATSPPSSKPDPSNVTESRAYHSPTFSMTTQSSHGSVMSPTFDFHPEPLKISKPASLYSPTLSITTPAPPSRHPDPSRPKTSTSAHGPRFSISTRRSSLNFSNAPPNLSRASSMPSEVFVDDDADLESLPSELDLDVLPWTDLNAMPATFRNAPPRETQSPASSRGSSFDSAEPPPIRRAPNYPRHAQKPVPKTPKKRRASLAALLFSRSPAPLKAILYSQTNPGPPPIPVALSGKGISSNTATLPPYRGQSLPHQMSEERVGRQMSNAGSVKYGPPRRGVSQGAAQRRSSWIRNEADKAFGRGQSFRKKAVDQTSKINLYV